MHKRFNPVIFLVIEFFLLTFLIVCKSLVSSNGYVTPDSTSYLSLAQNLLNGNGFYTAGFGTTPGADKQYFAIWPVGYPALIYLVSVVFKVSVFWSSKFINILCLGFIFRLLYKVAGSYCWIIALVFFLYPVLDFFTYTWSEIPFVTALFYLLYFINSYLNRYKYIALAGILLCSLAMFLFRYIGYMCVPLLNYVALILFIRRDYKRGLSVMVLSAFIAISIFLYLNHNKVMTGFPTGIERVPARETILQFAIMLVVGFYMQFEFVYTINFLPVLIACIALLIYKKKAGDLFKRLLLRKRFLYPRSRDLYLIGGMVYLLMLTFNRYQAFFDNFNMRLLAPGLIMIFVVVVLYLILRLGYNKYLLIVPLLVVAIFSYSVSMAVTLYKKTITREQTYHTQVSDIQKRYSDIPMGAVVLCGNRHMAYMRPDLVIAFPHYVPLNNSTETWDEFLARVKTQFPQKKIYMLATDGENIHPLYHVSIRNYVQAHPGTQTFLF